MKPISYLKISTVSSKELLIFYNTTTQVKNSMLDFCKNTEKAEKFSLNTHHSELSPMTSIQQNKVNLNHQYLRFLDQDQPIKLESKNKQNIAPFTCFGISLTY